MSFFNVEWVFKKQEGQKMAGSPVVGGKFECIPAKDKKDAAIAAKKMLMLSDMNIHIVAVTEL